MENATYLFRNVPAVGQRNQGKRKRGERWRLFWSSHIYSLNRYGGVRGAVRGRERGRKKRHTSSFPSLSLTSRRK